MSADYVIESAADSQEIIQLLGDQLYEHNSAKLNKNDGVLFSKIVRGETKKLLGALRVGLGLELVRSRTFG